ncbi:sugar ABC transporter permease [Donghicola sp. C2-DW-16]|uniref:Sugar ABC transporter permease n=1 Tax=Donghicola mangrovi TaxID=2729614 RepID=A0A850QFV8_9RHOB|nr:sugar ABC transporter permease [Donghicola mangrovi]NVO25265.1 sugar ABC transporter permease [Donghicola mangrovi]NVO27236.1 sugar ABC transporter permease [Donghicola mangrovi]
MSNPHSNGAWLLLVPALGIMGFVAVIPLVAVFNFSFHDIFTIDEAYWIGPEWFTEITRDPQFWASLGRSALFSLIVLSIQVPLGVWLALLMLKMGRMAVPVLMLVALPLVVPWNMIAGMWLTLINPEHGLAGRAMTALGIAFDYKFTALHTWVLIVLADTWHWLGLVVILAYAGVAAIPEPYRQAAAIDGASRLAVFRYIELPRITGALSIVLLLRFVDSFMIYTEAFSINAGGPNNATTFLSLELAADIGSYTYGRAAARAMLDFLIVLTVAWAFIRIRSTGKHQ